MRQKGIHALLFGMLILFARSAAVFAQHHHTEDAEDARVDDCAQHLPSVMRQFAAKERKDAIAGTATELAAYNDVRCNDLDSEGRPDPMANAVLVVASPNGTFEFVIIHVHFTPDGVLKGAAKYRTAKSGKDGWTKAADARAWRPSWCAFIFSVYPKEAVTQGC